jgi:sugar lactone lactonase YvrE
MPFADCAQAKFSSLRMPLILAMALAALLLPAVAHAQISFVGAQNTLYAGASGLSLSPVAVDSNGDAFFVTSNGTTTQLMEVPAGGSSIVINSSFPSVPTAIAVNPAGTTLYFIYYGSTTNCSGGSIFIATAPVSSGVLTNLPCSFTFNDGVTPFTVKYTNPSGLAVDPSGNLWIADEGGGDFFEILAPVTSTSVPSEYAALATGQPEEIAVNGNGEVYFTFLKPSGETEVQDVADISTSSFSNNLDSSPVTPTVIASNVPSIQSGLAISLTGNLYLGGSSTDSEIIGSTLVSVDEDFADGTEGMATDSNGNLYIAGEDVTGTPYVVELNKNAASFGSQTVEETSNPLTLGFIIANTTVGSIGLLTTGQANQDFASASGTTCTAHAYTSATACIVNVTFTPQAPGLRAGALVFYSGANQTGTVLAKVPLYGTGTGPEVGYFPGTLIAIDPTVNTLQLKYPQAVAVDGAGDLYIADYSNDRVVKVPAGAGAATSIDPSVGGKSLSGPQGVALDGAGDLFIADAGNERIVEVAIDGTLTAIAPTVNGKGFDDPLGIAVDGAGDLFVADQYNNRVVEVPSGGGTAIAIDPTAGGKSLFYPTAVAVDASGDLFIADYQNSRVVKVPPGGGTPTAIAPAPNGQALDGVVGVAVDAAGDLYISNFFSSQIVEVPADGSAPTAVDTFVDGSSVYGPQNIAVDTAGNLFIADYESWRIVEVQHSVPPTLSFPTNTLVGSTDTADGPQTVTIRNIGNYGLLFFPPPPANPAYPPGFPENTGDGNLCSYIYPEITQGGSCDISADFKPVSAGTNTGDIVLFDNAENQSGGLQSIPLTGANNQTAQTIDFTPPASPVNYGVSPVTLVATGGASGNSVVFSIDGSSTGTGSISGNMLTVTGVGNLVIDANQAGNTTYAPAPQVQETLVVNQAPQTISFTPPASPVNYGVSPITLAATGGASGKPVVFSVLSGPGSVSGTNGTTLSITGVGTVMVAANQAGNSDYAAATQATQSVVVNAGPQTIAFPAPASPVTFPVSPITLAATGGASGNPVIFSVLSGPGTVSGTNGTTLTITDSGTVMVAANQAGNSLYATATQVTHSIVVNSSAVSLSATSLSFGDQEVSTTSASQSVTLTNTGTIALSISSIAVTGTDASSFVFANSCGSSLAAGANCSIHGHFTPTTAGPLSAAVTITDNAPGSPQSIALNGTGVTPPAVSLTSTSLSFGDQVVETTSASQSVTLTNTGGSPMSITSIAVTGTNASSFVFANSCGTTLAAGANCSIHGHFTPTTTGPLSAAVTITDNASGSPQSISLSGTGVTMASLSSTSLSYGNQEVETTSLSQSVTLTNTSVSPMSITSIAVTGTDASSFVFANSCGSSLAAGASCSIHGHFTPTTTGPLSAAVTITDNASGSPQSIALSGTGATAPAVSLTSTSLSFPDQAMETTSASQSVTMTNTGGSPLSITSISVTGANASSFVFANSCGSSLAAGANCTIHGHFTPTTTGPLSAAVTITDNASGSPKSISLSGTGVTAPAVSLTSTSLSFPDQTVETTSASQSVTMTNTGGSTLTITSIAVTGTDASSFVFANSCGTSLAAGANCTIHGHFTPTTTGPLSAAVTITDNASGSPQSITLSGTGQ